MLGEEALPVLVSYIKDTTQDALYKGLAVEGLLEITRQHPDVVSTITENLIELLQPYKNNDSLVNAYLISALAELKAETSLSLIEAAFDAKLVDLSYIGRDYIQYKFGLISEEEYNERIKLDNPFIRALFGEQALSTGQIQASTMLSEKPKQHKDKAKVKAKRKIAKESRKKNRRK